MWTKEEKRKYLKEWRENNKDYLKEWRENNKDKLSEYAKEYSQTPRGKIAKKKAAKKFRQSPKGKAARKKYDQSLKAITTRKKYDQSPKRKANQKKSQKKSIKKYTNIIYELKNEKKCAKCGCGFDDCLSILEFHHINTKAKLFNINMRDVLGKSPEQIQEEVNKCILLCANCHKELHHPEYNNE